MRPINSIRCHCPVSVKKKLKKKKSHTFKIKPCQHKVFIVMSTNCSFPEEVGILLIHALFLSNPFSKGKMP